MRIVIVGCGKVGQTLATELNVEGNNVTVKGPKGELTRALSAEMNINQEGNVITVTRPSDEKSHRSLHGLTRTLLNNMVEGVEKGYSKELEINGVGFRAEKKGTQLVMRLGYSHEVIMDEIPGITVEVPAPNKTSNRPPATKAFQCFRAKGLSFLR